MSNGDTSNFRNAVLNRERWKSWGSCTVSDALRCCGKAFQSMDGGIKPLSSKMKMAGPAFTVRCYPGATWAVEQAIETAQPGEILVVDAGGRDDLIVLGGLMSTRAQQRGIAGVVVDGAVRDVDDIIELGFPICTRFICSRAGTFAKIGELQGTICCGRVPVSQGDWIVADNSGVAVVPPDMMQQVAVEAELLHDRERRMATSLSQGKSLSEASETAKQQ